MTATKMSAPAGLIRQSPPIDLTVPYEADWVRGRTILVTGGASGIGEAFVRHWAKHGATIIIGDVDVRKGDSLARAISQETGHASVHFVHCDVTDWQSQVNLFKEATRLSPHGGIDTVVANAGIAGSDGFQQPGDLSVAEPPEPIFKIMDVNWTGVLFTSHLAYYWLPRNPGSTVCSIHSDPASQSRDRHLLLIGSMASLGPIAVQPQYCASKHAVMGLFRSLRATSSQSGIRINIVCPYFIDTAIINPLGRLMLAGGATGKVDDVVDAATRFVADSRILGRGLVVGPKAVVKQDESGQWQVVDRGTLGSKETALWEPYADDWEQTEMFNRNLVGVLNAVAAARGWVAWVADVLDAIRMAIGLRRQ